MRNSSLINEKTLSLALDIIQICKILKTQKHEFILSNQVLRSGTSVGALVRESKYAESTKDFIHKLSIAQKESNETLYWLELLHISKYINTADYNKISEDTIRVLKILTSIITSTKRNNQIK